MLRVPFVDLLTTMTQPELPLTVHEYGEWGDPSNPTVLDQVFLFLVIVLLKCAANVKGCIDAVIKQSSSVLFHQFPWWSQAAAVKLA